MKDWVIQLIACNKVYDPENLTLQNIHEGKPKLHPDLAAAGMDRGVPSLPDDLLFIILDMPSSGAEVRGCSVAAGGNSGNRPFLAKRGKTG